MAISNDINRDNEQLDKDAQKKVSRRDFLKTSPLVGCGALVASQLDFARGIIARVEAGEITPFEAYQLMQAENTLYLRFEKPDM